MCIQTRFKIIVNTIVVCLKGSTKPIHKNKSNDGLDN